MNIDSILNFHESQTTIHSGAYLGWDHCYDAFQTKTDHEKLALHLAGSMGSYGMNRGKSLLRQTNYRVHVPAIPIILRWKHKLGEGSSTSADRQDKAVDINAFYQELLEAYADQREKMIAHGVRPKDVHSPTPTLITKVMLASLGCIPAYDRYFRLGLQKMGKIQSFGIKSTLEMLKFCESNHDDLTSCQKQMATPAGNRYPMMKVVDLYFWLLGRNTSSEEE